MNTRSPRPRDESSRAAALLVHEASVPYLRSVVEFVRHQLSLHLGREPFYSECADVATAGVPAGTPGTAPGLATVIGDCRLVANVHFADCDTLEAPRIVHAFTAGVCLVTEPCYGLTDLAPTSCYVCVPYRRIPDAISDLLRNPARIEAISRCAAEHIHAHYAVRATESWRAIAQHALAL